MLTPPFAIRDYRASDRAACLALFDSNVPAFFLPAERQEFEAFLDDLPGPYFIGEEEGQVVACGGYALAEGGRRADLCWGMVHRDRHRRGLGKRLARHRVERARRHPGVREVALQTSQHTAELYRTLGFQAAEVEPDGFGEGMDRWDMRLRVEPTASPGPPWLADRDLHPDEVRAAIDVAFPEVEFGAVEHVGSGWEFDVYRARDAGGGVDWAFRFPRRREYATGFDTEAVVLPRVGPAVSPVQTPRVELRAGPGPHFPYEFCGHRFIEGRRADAPGVVISDRFAAELGGTLARLHRLKPDPALEAVIGNEEEGPVEWFEEALGEADGLRGLGSVVDSALQWLESDPPVPSAYDGPPRLVHNDLCPDHLLVDEAGDLVGIIDWTDTAVGDPVLDFIVLLAWRGQPFVDAVLRSYEAPRDEGFPARLAFAARVRTLHWLHTAVREGGDVSKHRAWVANALLSATP